MAIQVTRMVHTAVNVEGRREESREFYTGFLGLPEVPVDLPGLDPEAKDLPFFWLQKEAVQMHIIALPQKGAALDPAGGHVSWYVEDIGEAVDAIEARGLEMLSIGEGRGRIVWIADPAGNTLEFQQDPDC
jgi:catechol 2,3-dioxygenase-like lactoylglutathione lyase family enzyme